jgi:hypothetical protein
MLGAVTQKLLCKKLLQRGIDSGSCTLPLVGTYPASVAAATTGVDMVGALWAVVAAASIRQL